MLSTTIIKMADSDGESDDVVMGEVQFDREISPDSDDDLVGPIENKSLGTDGDDVPMTESVFVFQGTPVTGANTDNIRKRGLAVVIPPATRRWEYQLYDDSAVQEVLEEYDEDEDVTYLVKYTDGSQAIVSEKPHYSICQFSTASQGLHSHTQHVFFQSTDIFACWS